MNGSELYTEDDEQLTYLHHSGLRCKEGRSAELCDSAKTCFDRDPFESAGGLTADNQDVGKRETDAELAAQWQQRLPVNTPELLSKVSHLVS